MKDLSGKEMPYPENGLGEIWQDGVCFFCFVKDQPDRVYTWYSAYTRWIRVDGRYHYPTIGRRIHELLEKQVESVKTLI